MRLSFSSAISSVSTRTGEPDGSGGEVDRRQYARQVALAADCLRNGKGTVQPLQDLEVSRRIFRTRGITRGGNLADLGKRGPQTGRAIVAPGEGAGVAKVIGEVLGAAGLAEDLGKGPGFHGLLQGEVGLEPHDLVQAVDRLAVVAVPGQAEGAVEPGVGIVRILGRKPAEGIGGGA